ncbi:hypothetical protein [Luteolibacter soli]|uniref:Lipoprotein n=1 Tax=Luteolibacter soli TaxID=3135280 RepID=A0ABU9ATW6_9BACT
MTVRQTLSLIPALVLLASCDKVLQSASSGGKTGSIADEIRISSESKPQIVAAFEAIADATNEHNRVVVQNVDNDGPVNELAFSAGIASLDQAARKHGGLGKQIIDAVNATRIYEKSLFTPFDTMRRQAAGMGTWSKDQAVQARGWVQIIDSQMDTYNQAIAYLERGEEPLMRQNFGKYWVPNEVADEFLRLRELYCKEVREWKREMFREEQQCLQCYRDALTTADPAKANELLAEAKQHDQKSQDCENKMISAVRAQLGATGLL